MLSLVQRHFVIASHIAEHVLRPQEFIDELTRIGKRGYIEVPKPLFDNITIGNRLYHPWWVCFDDVEEKLVYMRKLEVLKESLFFKEYDMLPFFRKSMVTELYWEDSIEWKEEEHIFYFGDKVLDLRDKNLAIKQWILGEVTAEQLLKR